MVAQSYSGQQSAKECLYLVPPIPYGIKSKTQHGGSSKVLWDEQIPI
jgi:hypothetical protein